MQIQHKTTPRVTGLAIALIMILAIPHAMAGVQITNVSANPQVATLENNPSIEVQFRLSDGANASLIIYDARDYEVRRITAPSPLSAGDHTLIWDTRDNRGHTVTPGAYRYIIHATDSQGNEVVHDLSDITGGESVDIDTIKVDPNTGDVTYHLDHSARIFIRYGIAEGPMLGTLLNGVVRTAGVHQEPWDGWDSNKLIPLASHPKLEFYGQGFQLSRNTLILRSKGATIQPLWNEVQRHAQQRRPQSKSRGLNPHVYHDRQQCRDFSVTVSPLNVSKHTEDGIPIIHGPTPFRVEIAEEDASMVEAQRFEVSYFLDNQLIYENEISYNPYTWTWTPQGLGPGDHYMTAFVLSYGGHFGTVTTKFRLEPELAKQ